MLLVQLLDNRTAAQLFFGIESTHQHFPAYSDLARGVEELANRGVCVPSYGSAPGASSMRLHDKNRLETEPYGITCTS
jgi:hypothetical protein